MIASWILMMPTFVPGAGAAAVAGAACPEAGCDWASIAVGSSKGNSPTSHCFFIVLPFHEQGRSVPNPKIISAFSQSGQSECPADGKAKRPARLRNAQRLGDTA